MDYEVGNFSELADNRLYSCTPVVGFIKPKNLRNSEYKLCLNERAILGILDQCNKHQSFTFLTGSERFGYLRRC